jgi:hypothetical protein
VGSPRYLSLRDSFGTSRIALIFPLTTFGHPFLKKREDFSLLILYPDALQYTSKISFTFVASAEGNLLNNIQSSAKKIWLIFGVVLATWIPSISLLLITCLRRQERPSTTKIKRYGDIGSPWVNTSARLKNLRTPSIKENREGGRCYPSHGSLYKPWRET